MFAHEPKGRVFVIVINTEGVGSYVKYHNVLHLCVVVSSLEHHSVMLAPEKILCIHFIDPILIVGNCVKFLFRKPARLAALSQRYKNCLIMFQKLLGKYQSKPANVFVISKLFVPKSTNKDKQAKNKVL